MSMKQEIESINAQTKTIRQIKENFKSCIDDECDIAAMLSPNPNYRQDLNAEIERIKKSYGMEV